MFLQTHGTTDQRLCLNDVVGLRCYFN